MVMNSSSRAISSGKRLFEVLDLDGSDLYKRLFQSPIPSEPTLAWAEEIMRHGVVATPETLGHMQALDSLWLPSADLSRCLDATSAPLGRRLMTIRPRASLHRASFHPPCGYKEVPESIEVNVPGYRYLTCLTAQ